MTAMKVYLQSELERQHAVANQTKGICEEQMKKVAQGLNEVGSYLIIVNLFIVYFTYEI